MNWQHNALLIGASMIAGAINSVAGGGTLLTFPALLATGMLSTSANATSTVALWPGQLSSLWGYRKEIGETRATTLPMSLLGLVGGAVGAFLLLVTPATVFDRLVPFLVLLATGLFLIQEPLAKRRQAQAVQVIPSQATPTPGSEATEAAPPAASPLPRGLTLPIALLLGLIAVYGGYFGAGIGILTLAALGFLGFRNIHQMNGVKNIYTLGINGISALIFVWKGLVDWRTAGIMAIGAIVGGYAGAGIARRLGQKNVRRLVIGIGFALTLSLLYRALHRA